jgi:hypothetical protein
MAIILAKWLLAKPLVRCLFPARSEFCNYAVGPWVSVAGRETTLARGNPAIRKEEVRIQKDEMSLQPFLNS